MYADRGGTPTSGPPFDHYEAKPGTMFGKADEIMGKGKKVDGVSDQVATAHRPAAYSTHGAVLPLLLGAPKPVRQQAQKVNQTTAFAAGCVRLWGNGIKTFDGGVDKLNTEWNEAVKDDFGLTKPTKPSTSGTPIAGNVRAADSYNADLAAFEQELSAKKAAKAAELRKRFGHLETKLDNAAEKVAGLLKKGPDDAKSVAALVNGGALSAMLALTLFPKVQVDDLTLSRKEKRALARQVAEVAKRLVGDGKLTDEEVKWLGDRLSGFENDKTLNTEFVESLGGRDTLGWIMLAAGSTSFDKQHRTLTEGIRRAVSIATRNLDAASARTFANQLGDAVEYWDPNADETKDLVPPSIALSYLLKDQRHGTDFLVELGGRLENIEGGEGSSAWTEGTLRSDVYQAVENLFGVDPPNGPDPEGISELDPVASYMSALGRNGEASLEFFTGGEDFDDLDASERRFFAERQRYWIQQRDWGHDDFDGLLAALDSATTDPDLAADDGSRLKQVKLTSALVDYLANRPDESTKRVTDDDAFIAGNVSDDATRHLAHIISAYLPSVENALGPYGKEDRLESYDSANSLDDLKIPGLSDGDLENWPLFERTELAKIIRVAVSTEEGFGQLREGVSHYESYRIANAVRTHDLEDVAASDGALEAFFIRQVSEVDLESAKSRDAQVKAWIDLGHTAVDSVPTRVPLAGFLVDQGTNIAADEIDHALANDEQNVIERIKAQDYPVAYEAHKYQLARALYPNRDLPTWTEVRNDTDRANEIDKLLELEGISLRELHVAYLAELSRI